MEKRDKLEAIRTLEFAFAERPFHHKYALDAGGLSFGYDPGRPLIRDFSMSIGARDRVFVIGRNGRGKTTLLRLIAGVLAPRVGDRRSAQSVAVGLLRADQHLDPVESNTVLEEIASAEPEGTPSGPGSSPAAMMFEGDDALKKIKRPVGRGEEPRPSGQAHRHAGQPAPARRADEPPRHRVERRPARSHRRIRRGGRHGHAQRDVPPRPGRAAGRLPARRDRRLRRRLPAVPGQGRLAGRVSRAPSPPGRRLRLEAAGERPERKPKELRRLRSEIVAGRSRVLRPLEKRMTAIEKDVETHDASLRRLNGELVKASRAAGRQGRRDLQVDASDEEDDRRTARGAGKAHADHEAKKAGFDARMRELDEAKRASEKGFDASPVYLVIIPSWCKQKVSRNLMTKRRLALLILLALIVVLFPACRRSGERATDRGRIDAASSLSPTGGPRPS